MTSSDLSTDYLIIGAGISGLCFADEMITRSDAHLTIVDARHAPGGHWNDAYSFVKLHQPATIYGVESTSLGDDRIDEHGPNKGFLSLASGPEITAYCHAVMRDRLLPSGRVTYLPMSSYVGHGAIRSLLSGRTTSIQIRNKLVDASYYTNSIPLTHRRAFHVEPPEQCIPPNDLPRLAPDFDRYTVLGAGKTAIDTCLWLLDNGADPDRIRWIIPKDQWFVNRATIQPHEDFFLDVFKGFAVAREDIAAATSLTDLARRHEQSGLWLRLDSAIEPTAFHAAHMSEGEIIELRRIENIVRLGRVRAIDATKILLTNGEVAADKQTLYVDCTASAVPPKPAVPVFQERQIVIQAVRFPQIPFSSALIAFLESYLADDAAKNAFTSPVPVVTTVEAYIRGLKLDMENRLQISQNREVRQWVQTSRLDGFSRMAAAVRPDETDKLALLERIKAASAASYANLSRLMRATAL